MDISQLPEVFATWQALAIAIVASTTVTTLKAVFGKEKYAVVRRSLPLLSEAIGGVLACIPGLAPESLSSFGSRLVWGIVVGALASKLWKTAKVQTESS